MSYIDYLKSHAKEDFKLAAKEQAKSYIWLFPLSTVLLFFVITFIGYQDSK